MPSWLPGDDYYTNFHEGDPFLKVPEGYARLPGAGYEALHPELKDVSPEDYPDIHKMAILTDVAPYSREYNTYRQRVGKEAQGNTELEIEYEKILNRVKKTRESVIRMQDRHFTAPVDEISGTVDEVSREVSHSRSTRDASFSFHRCRPGGNIGFPYTPPSRFTTVYDEYVHITLYIGMVYRNHVLATMKMQPRSTT